ncbi:hypothetical protein HY483_03645 [Candidatus Woesearchaeota archaeon]|nr:hypothetical protein [Candidatus Woesearchaeota archaeon]
MKPSLTLENALERRICNDPEFLEGIFWGKSRPGHPEGTIALHVKEVLDNIDKLSVDADIRRNLRIIALIHDSFKYKVDPSKNRTPVYHHGFIARKFAEKYVNDLDILDIIELHDEAFRAWARGHRYNNWREAEVLARKLIGRIKDMKLYMLFYKCDTMTGDKSHEGYDWFGSFVSKHS